ncbi:MAG: hypothetical protein COB04_18420 [Gammaproteobacteria bacterium]|nr:MAG: hypothetical protein COB04_18420 [Gammaproteobacteria bacterium]
MNFLESSVTLAIAGLILGFLFVSRHPNKASQPLHQATAYPVGASPALVGHDVEGNEYTMIVDPEASADTSIALGIRSNNPLNIRYLETNQWLGQVGQSAGGYCIFLQPVYGIRAAARTLRSYQKRGVITLADIVSTWAPHGDNNPTNTYINNVATWTGIHRDAIISEADYPELLAAMIRQENGSQPYSMALIEEGVSMA